MRRFALPFALIWVSAATSAQQAACIRNDLGVFEDIACAADALKFADVELNETYRRLLGLLSPEEVAALRKAQRAWLDYLKSDAHFTETREGDGSSGRLVIANNRERQTRERTLELKSWIPR